MYFKWLIFIVLFSSWLVSCEFELNQSYVTKANKQVLNSYVKFLNTTCKNSLIKKLYKVNDYFNTITPIHDAINYQEDEHWANILEFFENRGGDCEDYALAKQYTLELLGVKPQNMFLAISKDLYTQSTHMVLIVKKEKELIILDNLSFKLLSIQQRSDLRVEFLIREKEFYKYDYTLQKFQKIERLKLPQYENFKKNIPHDLIKKR